MEKNPFKYDLYDVIKISNKCGSLWMSHAQFHPEYIAFLDHVIDHYISTLGSHDSIKLAVHVIKAKAFICNVMPSVCP